MEHFDWSFFFFILLHFVLGVFSSICLNISFVVSGFVFKSSLRYCRCVSMFWRSRYRNVTGRPLLEVEFLRECRGNCTLRLFHHSYLIQNGEWMKHLGRWRGYIKSGRAAMYVSSNRFMFFIALTYHQGSNIHDWNVILCFFFYFWVS